MIAQRPTKQYSQSGVASSSSVRLRPWLNGRGAPAAAAAADDDDGDGDDGHSPAAVG